MPPVRPVFRILGRICQILLLAVALASLAGTGWWLSREREWAGFTGPAEDPAWTGGAQPNELAFRRGTLGLEFAPFKYVAVMGSLSSAMVDRHQVAGQPWPAAYGFIANPASEQKPLCQANAAREVPVGFTLSRLLPKSAAPNPVAWVGLSCAACHSAPLPNKPKEIVYGAGTRSLDVIAFTDALRNAMLDPDLSATKILAKYDEQCAAADGRAGWLDRELEWLVIALWLQEVRSDMIDGVRSYDLPYAGAELVDATKLGAGPSRTRPFRSVVRVALDVPAHDNLAYSKIPGTFEQSKTLRPRAQFDGSIADPVTRSLIAAYTSGSSVAALAEPSIAANIRAAAAYTLDLGPKTGVPTFASVFGPLDPAKVERGFEVFRQNCAGCHGYRPTDGGPWRDDGAGAIHKISLLRDIGTDPYRVTFRYAELLPDALYTQFVGLPAEQAGQERILADRADGAEKRGAGAESAWWKRLSDQYTLARRAEPGGHPLRFARDDLIYDKAMLGYINNPIPLAYLKAPYLHNGSIPSLAQLIGLRPRQAVFCRGDNAYDPQAVGLAAPEPAADGNCPPTQPFRFDTGLPGNSNGGHRYPAWAFPADGTAPTPDRRDSLADLLEYLKTL